MLKRAGADGIELMTQLLGPNGSLLNLDGAVLAGSPDAFEQQPGTEVVLDGVLLGVIHASDPTLCLALLRSLAKLDGERRAVTEDALERYRELSLLYTLGAKMAGSDDPDRTASTALAEASRLIGTDEAVVLIGPDSEDLAPAAQKGSGFQSGASSNDLSQFAREIVEAERSDVIERIGADHPLSTSGVTTLVFCPFEVTGPVGFVGLLLLGRQSDPYRSVDLKLLGAVASQAGPALASAFAARAARTAALAREQALEQQIEQLRVELDSHGQQERVREITSSDYFQSLRGRAESLRNIIDDTPQR